MPHTRQEERNMSQQERASNNISSSKSLCNMSEYLWINRSPVWTKFQRHREAFLVGRKVWQGRRVKLWSKKEKNIWQHPFCYSSQQRASTAEMAPSANSSNSLRVQTGLSVPISRHSPSDVRGGGGEITKQIGQPSTAFSKMAITFSSAISLSHWYGPAPHPHI